MSGSEDRDSFAAEFALGVLTGDEALEAVQLARTDPDFARLLAIWERRLAPLADTVASAVPPPEIWDRVAATTGASVAHLPTVSAAAPKVPVWRRLGLWQGATGAALALAAALAALIVVRAPPPPQVAVLATAGNGGGVALLAVRAGPDVLAMRPERPIDVPAGKDLELWALPPGAQQPRSLGVLAAHGQNVPGRFPSGTVLMVSLEPKGGSPSGQPTGPVLYQGRLGSI